MGGAEPETERLTALPIAEERLEVPHDLRVELLLRGFDGFSGRDHLRDVLGELVEAASGLAVVEGVRAVGRVGRCSGAPHLVALADVVARLAEHQGITRDRRVPTGSLEDGSHPGPPEILARQQRAPARRARRCGHVGVAEEDAFPRDAIDVRRVDHVVQRPGPIDRAVGAGVTAPVIGEDEQDVRPLVGGHDGQGAKQQQERRDEGHG